MTKKLDKTVSKGIKTVNKVNKFTIKKERAIELWRETHGHISDICRTIGISRTTFYNWLEKDPEFVNSLAEAEGELNDDIRNVLIQKAADGDMTAVIFYLKNRHPDFKQQTGVYIKGDKMEMAFIDRDGKEINSTTK